MATEYEWHITSPVILEESAKIDPETYSRPGFMRVQIELLRSLCKSSLSGKYNSRQLEFMANIFIGNVIWAEQQPETFSVKSYHEKITQGLEVEKQRIQLREQGRLN